MNWPVRVQCTACWHQHLAHPVPLPDLPLGPAKIPVTTTCVCGHVFSWLVLAVNGKVLAVVADDGEG